jgi:hypothetical protein
VNIFSERPILNPIFKIQRTVLPILKKVSNFLKLHHHIKFLDPAINDADVVCTHLKCVQGHHIGHTELLETD